MMKTPPAAPGTDLATQVAPLAEAQIMRRAMRLGMSAAVPETQASETTKILAAIMVDGKVADRAASEMTMKPRLARGDMEDLGDEVVSPIVTGRMIAPVAARAAAEMTMKSRLARGNMEDLEDEVIILIVTGRMIAPVAVMEASKVAAREGVPTTTR
jgi:hypothetical protein